MHVRSILSEPPNGKFLTLFSVCVVVVLGAHVHTSKDTLLDTVSVALPQFPAAIFDLIKLFASFNTSLGIIYAVTRMVMGIARDGEFPEVLAQVDGDKPCHHRLGSSCGTCCRAPRRRFS